MRQDVELLREILLKVEELGLDDHWCVQYPSRGGETKNELNIPGYSSEDLIYHIDILHQQGLIDARNVDSHDARTRMVFDLTAEGHKSLAVIRKASAWNKVKKIALDTTGTITIAAIQASIKSLIDR